MPLYKVEYLIMGDTAIEGVSASGHLNVEQFIRRKHIEKFGQLLGPYRVVKLTDENEIKRLRAMGVWFQDGYGH